MQLTKQYRLSSEIPVFGFLQLILFLFLCLYVDIIMNAIYFIINAQALLTLRSPTNPSFLFPFLGWSASTHTYNNQPSDRNPAYQSYKLDF